MEKLIAQFPKHVSDAINIARSISIKEGIANKKFQQVVICGMGGSGIGGKLIQQWFAREAKIPVVLAQDYTIPAFVNNDTLVIVSSYSGNTEETISALNAAIKCGAIIIGVTSGGELMKICQAKNYPLVEIPGGNPPRSMLAFSTIQLVGILAKLGIIHADALDKIDPVKQLLTQELVKLKDEAKEIATLIFNKQVVIYASSEHEATALRFRQQLNENSKQLALHNILPEMNHNELVGWAAGTEDHAVLFIGSELMDSRNKKRMQLTEEIIRKKTPHVKWVNPKGNTLLLETFYLIHLLDWTSLYMAQMNQADPVEVKVIDYLKEALSKA